MSVVLSGCRRCLQLVAGLSLLLDYRDHFGLRAAYTEHPKGNNLSLEISHDTHLSLRSAVETALGHIHRSGHNLSLSFIEMVQRRWVKVLDIVLCTNPLTIYIMEISIPYNN